MLKPVENPDSAQLAQGVMVTPEGGYVVAQPDLCVHRFQIGLSEDITLSFKVHHGKNK
jgi:protein MPE1